MKYNQPFGISDPNASYINGNPDTGTMGSIPPAESIEHDMREIVEVIQYAYDHGYRDRDNILCQPPSSADLTQLRKAIWGFINADRLALNLDYYVNNTGSDTNNDGLSAATPFLTIQKAINMANMFDPNGFTVAIHVADGTYAGFNAGQGVNLKGWGRISLIGNITTPAACLIQSADIPCALFVGKPRSYVMGGFKIINNGALPRYGCGILCADDTQLTIYNMEFGHCTMYHMWASNSTITLAGLLDGVPNVTYPFLRVSGGATHHMRASEGGAVGSHCPDMTITQALTLTGAWCDSDYLSHVIFVGEPFGSQTLFYNSLTGAANVTGMKYSVSSNSIITTNGGVNYFPGTVAGQAVTGGQYT